MTALITHARSLLFVPGNRPERFDKAVSSEADAVILDLEDAVPPSAKEQARRQVAEWLDPTKPVLVRINASKSPWFFEDLAICRHPAVVGVVMPKAETGPALDAIAAIRPVLALIETAIGVRDLNAICAHPQVQRLAVGSIDLSLDLGIEGDQATLDPIFLWVIVASRAAGMPSPVSGVTPDFTNLSRVEIDTARAGALGFGGKLCIHPAQIAPVHNCFRPSNAEIEAARRIVSASAEAAGAATTVDGQMVDRPIVERARKILSKAGNPLDGVDSNPGGGSQ
jgi:citrate lyase subunit beta/citryl-CoA lyase